MTAIKKNIRHLGLAVLASVIGLFVVYQVHFMDGKISMFGNYTPTQDKIDDQINNNYFDEVLDYHKTEPSFKRRLFTTFFIDEAMTYFNWPSGKAFLWVNFSLLFLCGLVLFYLAIAFTNHRLSAIFSVLIFYGSITILTAFFASNYSYDEPMQYLLLLVSLLAFKRERLILFFLFFTAAALSRESTLLLVPGLVLVFFQEKKWGFLVSVLISLVGYFIYQNFLLSPLLVNDNVAYQSTRFDLLKLNFESLGRTLESIMSAFVVVGVAVYYFLFRKVLFKKMKLLFLITLVINTLVVWGLTNASESRLFALPLIFFWPLAGHWLCSLRLPSFQFKTKDLLYLGVLFIGVVCIGYVVLEKYSTTYLPIKYHFHLQYVLLSLALIFFCEVYRLGHKVKSLS